MSQKTPKLNLGKSKYRNLYLPIGVILFAALMTALIAVSDAAANITSVSSGAWSQPSTWAGGNVPSVGDKVTIQPGHDVLYDVADGTYAGVDVNGTLTFDPDNSTTLNSSQNVVVTGQLVMYPSESSINHTLRFVDIDETIFVGGGIDVQATDVGLWVMEDGQLYTKGKQRSGWFNATEGVPQDSNGLTLEQAPVGWEVGDEIVITPTAFGKGYDDFHETTITAVNDSQVTFADPTVDEHPKVNNRWTPEVMNLTRNVLIEGQPNQRSHIFIRSNKPQFIRWTRIQYMGPRDFMEDDQTGRYGLHFHHSFEGTNGSIVEGTVITKTNNHAYVPHASDGITLRDTVSYDTQQSAYWWDEPDLTNNSLWEHAIAAKADWLKGPEKFEVSGFMLGAGSSNEIRDSVAVGIDSANGGGFNWPAIGGSNTTSVWRFNNGTAHNGKSAGIAGWQNNKDPHTIENFAVYHNGTGIDHGAYTNNYQFINGFVYGNHTPFMIKSDTQIRMHAVSDNVGLQLINVEVDAAGRSEYGFDGCGVALPTKVPMVIANSSFTGHTEAAVRFSAKNECRLEFFDTVLEGKKFIFDDPNQDSYIDYQDDSESFRLYRTDENTSEGVVVPEWNARRVEIPRKDRFTGNGTGLRLSFYDDTELQDQKSTEVWPFIALNWNDSPAHEAVQHPDTSIRAEGEVQARRTGAHVFQITSTDGARLWINDQLVVDDWTGVNRRKTRDTSPIQLTAGQRISVRAEVYEDDTPTTAGIRPGVFQLAWIEPGTSESFVIPATQLYPAQPLPSFDPIIAPDPPLPPYVNQSGGGGSAPDTESPTAPTNLNSAVTGINVTLSWSASTDNVGVTAYEILRNDSVVASVNATNFTDSGLGPGTYTYTARAKDAAGNTSLPSGNTQATVAEPEDNPTADLNGDGKVNILDMSILLARWNTLDSQADLNSDGTVNILDLSAMLAQWLP